MVSHACVMQRSNGLAAYVGTITDVVMVYICTVGDVYMFSQPFMKRLLSRWLVMHALCSVPMA